MALEILDGEILNDDDGPYRPDFDSRDREAADEPPACGDCDGAGEVSLSGTSDEARPCPTCDGSGIGCYALGGAR